MNFLHYPSYADHPAPSDTALWNGGATGAACTRVRTRPDLVMDHPSIGALLLGGVRPSQLVAGRRVQARNADAVRRADAFFVTSPAPHCQSMF